MRFLAGLATMAVTGASIALAPLGFSSPASAATALPAHMFAPYVETFLGDNAATLAQQSGSRYVSLGFLATASHGSCTAYWDGDTSQPISSPSYKSQVAAIQAAGGNAIPSTGGAGADNGGTDIADSCSSVSAIAHVFENVFSTYNVPRIDLDVEGKSLGNKAGINRRNQAIAMAERWGASTGRTVGFDYTLPSNTNGPSKQDNNLLKNAAANHAVISVVDLMTFDYYTGQTIEMAQATESAGQGLVNELHKIYPSDSTSQLWAMVGVCEMNGVDDYGPKETFTEADAATVLSWARSKGIALITFWALERDNSSSGISQPNWYFSHTFEPFTGK